MEKVMDGQQQIIVLSLIGAMIVSFFLRGPVWYRRRWLLIALCAVLLAVNDWLGGKQHPPYMIIMVGLALYSLWEWFSNRPQRRS